MLVDIEAIKLLVRAAIDPAKPPDSTQVAEISRLTYIEEARKEIQRVMVRRLRHPYSYEPLEILHTLKLMKSCLSHVSSEFKIFCASQAQFLGSLEQYEGGGNPVAREISSDARSLSRVLINSVQPSGTHKAGSSSTVSRSVIFPDSLQERPAPVIIPELFTPELLLRRENRKESLKPEQRKQKRQNIKALHVNHKKTRLSTIKESLHEDQPESKHEHESKHEQSKSILLREKEEVAMMTFHSGNDGLGSILNAVDDLISPTSSLRKNYDESVKVLKRIIHCFYWGSAPFVELCIKKKTIFDLLRQHQNPNVRGHAYEIFKLLNEMSPSQEEKLSRDPLIPLSTTSAYPEAIRETPGQKDNSEPSVDISSAVLKTGSLSLADNLNSDVEGVYNTKTGEIQVVIRFLRTPGKPYDLFVKPLYREFLRWQALSHKNISPFYGLVLEHSAVGMAWPLYHNGTVLEYVKAHNDINTLHMLQEIADGVLYLHAKGIVHGDIRCAHIMVTDTGTPRLINYGLFQVVGLIMAKTGSITTSLPSSIRWSAPETLIADSPVQSKSEKSDVYAFASTCIELILLEEPYQGLSDPQVLKHVLVDGNVLARPSMKIKYSPNDPFWYFLTICWSVRPQERPNIVAFRRKLAEFSNVPTRADGTRKTCFKWPRWSDRTKHVSFSGPT